jgi:diguanylate cyclase (GGDEF)-like protein
LPENRSQFVEAGNDGASGSPGRNSFPLWLRATIILLALATAALFGPAIMGQTLPGFASAVQQAMLAFALLVLLFACYVYYQQKVIFRISGKLDEEKAERSRLESEVQTFHQMTLLDPLTGLYNRHFLEQHLTAELARCERHGYPLNLLRIDLADFRKVNSYYGPAGGDAVLKSFAECLRRSLRNSDLSVRTGPDEFVVVLPESAPERIPHILARMSGLEAELNGERISITFAAGWVSFQPGMKPQEMLEESDRELQNDKLTHRSSEAIRQALSDHRQSQAVEALGRLAGRVAHDFNNLLSLVKGYSELVLDTLKSDDPIRGHILQIHEANERASSLTRQLLAFSRSQETKRETIDLNSIVNNMEPLLRRLLGEEIELVVVTTDDLKQVEANRGQMEQIILDLAVNARESMPQAGRITIETRNVELDEAFVRWHPGAKTGEYSMLAVLDTGAGIDAEARAHIFEPFYAAKQKGKKNGLGLASVYGIVKQSGGYIWVDSEPGMGSRFAVYLPRVEKPVALVH